jgi:hypothetical protein
MGQQPAPDRQHRTSTFSLAIVRRQTCGCFKSRISTRRSNIDKFAMIDSMLIDFIQVGEFSLMMIQLWQE